MGGVCILLFGFIAASGIRMLIEKHVDYTKSRNLILTAVTMISGLSGADIDSVLNDAAILAVRKNKSSIGLAEIDEAIDRRISGPAKSSRGMSEKERRQVAYHEAGHAVIGLNLPYSDKVQKITIIPRGNTGGHVLMTPDDDRFLLTKNEMIARITGLLGGRASEEILKSALSFGDVKPPEVPIILGRVK